MRTLICTLFAAAMATSPVLAHPPGEDGEHDAMSRFRAPPAEQPKPVFSSAAAETKARAVVGTMVDRKIVGASWRTVAPASVATRERAGSKEWVVTFRNPKERARAKRTLYVFLSESGEYKAANHTGG